MDKRYKVTFEIQGEYMVDNIKLNMDNLELFIKQNLHEPIALSYFSNRNIDTKVENLKVKKVKVKLPF